MKNLPLKIVFILALFAITFYIVFPWTNFGINAPKIGPDYKLGLDLHGGVELDYKIDLEEAKKKGNYTESTIVEGLKSIIEKRVNSLGTAEPTILTSKYGNESHIIVQIPTSNFDGQNLTEAQKTAKNDEFIAKAKENIGKVVRLEFKEKKTEVTDADKTERKQIIDDAKKDLDSKEYDFNTIGNKYKDRYENVVFLSGTGTKDSIPQEVTFTGMENVTSPYISDVLETSKGGAYTLGADGKLQMGEAEKGYSIVKINSVKKVEKEKEVSTGTGVAATKKKEKYTEVVYNYEVIFVSQKPSEWTSAKTVAGQILDERYLIKANGTMNTIGEPQVELTFSSEGAKIFAELTKRMIGQQLAIFVGGELLTAPTVNTAIPDGKAVITGNYTIESAKKLANDITTGIVPAPIYLTSERAIDAKIGGDSLKVIINAGMIGFLFILIFLVLVYRFSGLLAGFALICYILITLALVKLAGVVFTLSSIAGLILSVGLAIDANILIFERSKEELRANTEAEKSINIGFDKSWSAIWDAHITSLVSAVILYLIGVNLIKGFGLMLGIGIVVSLFSAMWISRVLIVAFAPKFNKNICAFIGLKR
ncbi:MAG: protein translocase subunit SecD [Candidatus Gracilibacteria bacterium]|nr:protein translocase subunit SecD [Candidatus Gracilibacteria bacterium]MDD2908872.1 protein translocase subunit SecD [Candidatus Gracilibacteria bacterium]